MQSRRQRNEDDKQDGGAWKNAIERNRKQNGLKNLSQQWEKKNKSRENVKRQESDEEIQAY